LAVAALDAAGDADRFRRAVALGDRLRARSRDPAGAHVERLLLLDRQLLAVAVLELGALLALDLHAFGGHAGRELLGLAARSSGARLLGLDLAASGDAVGPVGERVGRLCDRRRSLLDLAGRRL